MLPILCWEAISAISGLSRASWSVHPAGGNASTSWPPCNAITHQLVTVTNDSYITATSVCELLEKIALLGLQGPITLVMDNARYQHCRLVLERAAHLGIEVLFLPTYSPHLNLIERLWKFVRKACLYAKYYENFELFKQALQLCLSETTGRHKAALSRLLTLEFQSFISPTPDL